MTAPNTPPRRRRRGWLIALLLLLLILAGIIGGAAYLFREQVQEEVALRRFRQAAETDDPALPQRQQELHEQLNERAGTVNASERLSTDPDPKVRSAFVDVLFTDRPHAKKTDMQPGLHGEFRTYTWFKSKQEEAVNRLLRDPDETVRRKTLQAVCELESADQFKEALTETVRTGSTPERVIVAAGLAHWNGQLLCEVIADLAQPDEVRIAALRSLDTYGNSQVAFQSEELTVAMKTALDSRNTDLQRAALTALRYGKRAERMRLDLLCDDQQKTLHADALKLWIDILGRETAPSESWMETHNTWYHTITDARRCAIASYVLCEGAKRQLHELKASAVVGEAAALQDQQGPTGRAFNVQLARLSNVLSALSAALWYCNHFDQELEMDGWLPHETPNGAAPVRSVKAFVFQQAKPIWEWCLAHEGGYATRFLHCDTLVQCYVHRERPQPTPVRTLGEVLVELRLEKAAFDRLRARYDGK